MSNIKRLLHKVQPILDEIFDNGQGTRMELFERIGGNMDETVGFNDDPSSWSDHKRFIGFLKAQGMIETVPCEQRMKGREGKDTKQIVIDLTEEGHEFVHSLRQ